MSASLIFEYVPMRGDIVWLDFDPHLGREQAKRRPALVLSPDSYNGKVGHAIVCPITNQVKNYPWEVHLPSGLGVSGVILSDQIKSLDWKARNAERICELPQSVFEEVMGKLMILLT